MGALDDMVSLLKGQVAKKEAKEAEKNGAPVHNPNAQRFAGLHNAEAVIEGTSREIEKPDALKQLEAKHGPLVMAGKIMRATAFAQKNLRHEDPKTAHIKALHDQYHDRETAKYLESCIEKDLSANIPNEGGYLIPEVVSDQMIESLYPKVVVLRLGATEIPMVNGNLSVNFIETGTTATYQGSGDAIVAAGGPTFGQQSWRSKKLVAMVPIDNDLLKVRSVKADLIVANDGLKQMAIRMNQASFQDDGSNNTPRGLKYETGLVTVSLSGLFDSKSAPKFKKAFANAFVDLEAAQRMGWAFNPDFWEYVTNLQDLNGQYYYRSTGLSYTDASGNAMTVENFEGAPKAVTTLIPTTGGSNPYTTDVYYGDWAEYWIPRQGMIEIASSDVAAYNVSSSTVKSAYSQDQTVIRLVDRHDMGMRQKKAMARASVTFNQ